MGAKQLYVLTTAKPRSRFSLMASAAGYPKALVLLLLIYCLLLLPLFVGDWSWGAVWFLFCNAVQCFSVHSNFCNHLAEEESSEERAQGSYRQV